MAKKRQLTDEQKENILNYGDQIEHIETFAEAARKLVGMYLGQTGSRGVLNMNREIFQNIIDQIIMVGGVATRAIVSYSEIDKISIYDDDGCGIPFEKLVDIFTSNHTSKNYTKDPYDFSSGLHGSGAKATCACSTFFEVESYILGVGKKMRFEEGRPIWDKLHDIPNPTKYQGTTITFKPDETVMNEYHLPWEIMYDLFTTMISLTQIGTVMTFNCIPLSGQPTSTVFVNEDGILYDLIKKTTKPLIKPIIISKLDPNTNEGKYAIDIALTYSAEDLGDEDISAFANWSPTTGGTHVQGFLDGLCKFFRDYMNKIYLGNNKKNPITIINSDIKTGLKAIVHARHLYPTMKGQSKEELNNEDIMPFIKQAVLEQLEEWAKTNPTDLQKLCKYIKDVAEVRIKSEKGKEKIVNSYNTNSVVDLPPKYKKPEAKMTKGRRFELWIVEGDSAGGSAADGRNEFQGILPIKGKSPNAFSTPRAKFLNNDEVKAYYAILGSEPGRNFDVDKVAQTWEKVIIGADGDVDGLHITTLELQKNLLYSIQLIERGMLYRAVPPLFGVNEGSVKKPKMIYYTENADYLKYIQSLFTKNNDIRTINGSKIHDKELEFIIATNINYVYELERISNNYSIDNGLLEDIAYSSSKTYNELYKNIRSKYKYLDITKKMGTTIISGEVGNSINSIYLNDRFMGEIEVIRAIMRKNQFINFKLNGNVVSLYEFMKKFYSYMKQVQRYKGLGEMDKDQLAESTLLPDNRTLVRYTVASAKEEIERIRYLESNKYELVQGQTMTRSDL